MATYQAIGCFASFDPRLEIAHVVDCVRTCTAFAVIHPGYHEEPEEILRSLSPAHCLFHRLVIIDDCRRHLRDVVPSLVHEELGSSGLETTQVRIGVCIERTHPETLVV